MCGCVCVNVCVNMCVRVPYGFVVAKAFTSCLLRNSANTYYLSTFRGLDLTG